MPVFQNLSPRIVWDIFEEILQVPRPSKKEGKIITYLEGFAIKHGLECRKDDIGNIVIVREASPSMTGRETIVLQSHMDMVCEKNSGTAFDFDTEPINAYVTEDGWVKAKGTTLGADDGIGMAAALAVLTDPDNEYPRIEALFTVDEETGLTGAFNLGGDMITGKYLINLDSEDEGEIFIGCAGGIDTVAEFGCPGEAAPEGLAFFRVDIKGLTGGHSGDDINKGLANSNKLMARLLLKGAEEAGLRLSKIDGGNLRNAIPRESFAVFGIPVHKVTRFFEVYETLAQEAKDEYSVTEPGMEFQVSEMPAEKEVLPVDCQEKLLRCLQGLTNGVLAMSMSMPGLVETSSNLASVKQEGSKITVVTSQRSSVDSARYDAAASIRSVFELAGATVKHSDGYPGWKPDPDSELVRRSVDCYVELFGNQPIVRAIHAGLECGLFLEKYPELEMVSFGPTIRGVHSPDERLEISTVDKFWKHLVLLLKRMD